MASFSLPIFIVFLSLLPLSSPRSSQAILDAAEILTDTGFASMALRLELAAESVVPSSSSLTIFSPTDDAFAQYGQPPLSLLQYHILPVAFSLHSLNSLPSGAKISTTLPGHPLTITTSAQDGRVSLNNVTIEETPIYDDGYLIIFGIKKFFDPHFENSLQSRRQRPSSECLASIRSNERNSSAYSLEKAASLLRFRGYSVVSSFLDLQVLGPKVRLGFTIFAPTDNALISRISNYSEWSSIFRRHVVPCKLRWKELIDLDDGTELQTYLEGFKIVVSRSGGILKFNNASVIFPDIHHSEQIVIHGVRQILEGTTGQKDKAEPPSEAPENAAQPAASFGDEKDGGTEHYHFSVYKS